MGSVNRAPNISQEARALFARVAKAEWVEMYRDLYLQTHGEDSPESSWIADAARRSDLLRLTRR